LGAQPPARQQNNRQRYASNTPDAAATSGVIAKRRFGQMTRGSVSVCRVARNKVSVTSFSEMQGLLGGWSGGAVRSFGIDSLWEAGLFLPMVLCRAKRRCEFRRIQPSCSALSASTGRPSRKQTSTCDRSHGPSLFDLN
jgi:hypothetical protein